MSRSRASRMWYSSLQVVLCASITACGGARAPENDLDKLPGQDVALITVYRSNEGDFRRTMRDVIRDSLTWSNVWDSIGRSRNPSMPTPLVDFNRKMLLVAVGPGLGAGDSVIVRRVLLTDQAMRVEVVALQAVHATGCTHHAGPRG